MAWVPFAVLFVAALAIALLITPAVRHLAVAVGSVDYPGGRRVNTRPIPRMGGIAVICALAGAAGLQWLGTTYWDWPVVVLPAPGLHVNYWLLALSIGIVFFTGLIDDIVSLRPIPKLIGLIVSHAKRPVPEWAACTLFRIC